MSFRVWIVLGIRRGHRVISCPGGGLEPGLAKESHSGSILKIRISATSSGLPNAHPALWGTSFLERRIALLKLNEPTIQTPQSFTVKSVPTCRHKLRSSIGPHNSHQESAEADARAVWFGETANHKLFGARDT